VKVKIVEIKDLALEGVKVVRFGRFPDDRGYFAEHYRKSDMASALGIPEFVQSNESFSRTGTLRGLHLQWNPYMGKLVRTLMGRMVDLVLDVRKGSQTFGKIIAYDLPAHRDGDFDEWIWLPPGFAHGNVFPQESLIEYFCTGEYSPGNEGTVSPFAKDLDWSLCAPDLKTLFDGIAATTTLVTQKDRDGHSLASWQASAPADKFVYSELQN
jgi:dTDP-4-dehydrorhamnose 3,5-epimerase